MKNSKKLLSLLLAVIFVLCFASCRKEENENSSQSQPVTDHVQEAQKLIDDGNLKGAYEYLYTNRHDEKAAEMLSDFLVVYEHADQKSYSRYNGKRVTVFDEHGEMIREEVTFPFNSYYSQNYIREYTITYDSEGKKTKSIEILNGEENKTELFTYNEQGLLHTFQNGYKVDTYTYDADGNTILIFSDHIDSPYTETQEFTYDTEGNLLNEISSYTGGGDEGDLSGFYYDIRYTYDSKGNLIRKLRISDENKTFRDTEYVYNDQGDVVTETEKITNTNIYDGTENTYEIVRSYGYTYDGEGRVTKKITETESATKTEEFVYNQQGDVIKESSETSDGEITISEFEYLYTDDGEVSQITEVQNCYTELTFDETFDDRGNVTGQHSVTATHDRSNSTVYTYDDKGRITKKVYTDPDGKEETVEYEYDDRNNVIKKICGNSVEYRDTYEYTYDEQDRVVKEVENVNGTVNVITKEYDLQGKLTKVTENPSYGEKKVREYRNQYDEQGKLLKVEYVTDGALVQITTYEYDSDGREIKRINYSAENKIIGIITTEYDEDGNVLREKCEAGEAGYSHTPCDYIYKYDEYGIKVYSYSAYIDTSTELWFSEFRYFYLPDRVEID